MSHTLTLRYRLRSPRLLRDLMQHTGDGTRTTTRELAALAQVHHSFIGKLLAGEQETVTADVAMSMSGRIGVDLLILWAPVERTDASRHGMPVAAVAAS
ncbi:XRE family transcriptional regulator [Kitasatospora sp. NPDC056076]|uniref:XRE family transcriptional regulator n=1 Tax=Streptomycetaceae TaxID=2062 RepID=UPI0035DB8CFA